MQESAFLLPPKAALRRARDARTSPGASPAADTLPGLAAPGSPDVLPPLRLGQVPARAQAPSQPSVLARLRDAHPQPDRPS